MIHNRQRLVLNCVVVSFLALALLATFDPKPVTAIPAPVNDDFPGTTVPGGASLTDIVSIRPVGTGNGSAPDPNDADIETGEPTANLGGECSSVNSTVWYSTTAPANGVYLVSTQGRPTNYDTVVRVFTGATVSSLTLIPAGTCCRGAVGDSCNDDLVVVGGPSYLVFCATAGTTYRIQVADFGETSTPSVGAMLRISIRFSPC